MLLPLKNAVECAACNFLPECGGIMETLSMLGCYSECVFRCNSETCDLTCPHNPRLLALRLTEIEGTFRFSAPPLNVPVLELSRYVPKIHNGSGRLQPLNMPVVAVPARALVSKSGLDILCRFKSPSQVRQHFCLSPRTNYVISCISVDEDIEIIWEGLKYGRLAEEFARLKPSAIIVPNFSFFTDDVPRTHTMYNRKRICMAARIFSEAGCRVIIPLSALTPNDWGFWYEVLKENPDMNYVAKEFQTGLSSPKAADEAINNLSTLQDRLGRSLHPVAFGGSRHSSVLNTKFDNFTIVESRAFMLMAQRVKAIQTEEGSYSEISSPTPLDEPTDELLRHNIKARMDRIAWRTLNS